MFMLKNKTFSSIGWVGLSVGIKAIAQLSILIVLSRTLTQTEYGSITAILIVFNLFWAVFEAGIGLTIVQRPKMDDLRIRVGFTLAILMGMIVALLISLCSRPLAMFLSTPNIPYPLYLVSLGIIIRSLSVVAEYLLQRDLKFSALAAIEFGAYGIGFTCSTIIACLFNAGIWCIAYGLFTYCIVKTILVFMQRRHQFRPYLNLKILKELLYYANGFWLGSFFSTSSQEIDKIFVGRFLGAGMLGIYGRVIQLFLLPASLIGQVIDKTFVSILSFTNSDEKIVKQTLKSGTSLFALTIIPFSILIYILAPEIVAILLGKDWTEVVAPLQIFSIAMYFRTTVKVSEAIIRAYGAVYQRTFYYIIYTLSVGLFAAIGCKWSLTGVAIGVCFSILLFYCLMTRLSLQISNLSLKEYIQMHLPSLRLSLMLGIFLIYLVPRLRESLDSPLLVVLSTTASCLIFGLIICRLFPHYFFGKENMWLLKNLSSFIKQTSAPHKI